MSEVQLSEAVRFTHDWIFKAVFTNKQNDYLPLRHLIHAIIGGDAIESLVIENREEEREHEDDKNIRLDIKATTDRGDLVNVEMQVRVPNIAELNERAAYYLSRMVSTQEIKGKEYPKRQASYCIFLCNFKLFEEEEEWMMWYQWMDTMKKEKVLTEKLNIIMIEIDKAHLFDGKGIEELNNLEKWVTVLNSSNLKRVEEIAATDGAIQEAVDHLVRINESDRARAIAESRYKKERDDEAFSLAYHRMGKEEGIQIGLQAGVSQATKQIAMNMLKDGMDEVLIMKYAGISVEQLEELKRQM